MNDGGRAVAPGIFAGFAEELARSLERGLRMQVAAGWVTHYRPQRAIEVVRDRLELARDEDGDTPEGFYFNERYGQPPERDW